MGTMSDIQSSFWITIIPIIIAISGGLMAYISYFYSKKKDKFNSLFQAFNYLNANEHREARRVIYYKKKLSTSDMIVYPRIILGFDISSLTNKEEVLRRVSNDIVRDDMDQMGLMIKSNLIPEKQFLERYWKTIIDVRWLLRYDIAKRRKLRDYKDYVINFDYLTNRACCYAKQEHLLEEKWKERCNYIMIGNRIYYDADIDRAIILIDKLIAGSLGKDEAKRLKRKLQVLHDGTNIKKEGLLELEKTLNQIINV